MKLIVVRIIQFPVRIYRAAISPLLPSSCRFHPTCSGYALEALERHGVLKGLVLSLVRVGKCHPWCMAHWHDPVPKRFTWGDMIGYKRMRSDRPCGHSHQIK